VPKNLFRIALFAAVLILGPPGFGKNAGAKADILSANDIKNAKAALSAVDKGHRQTAKRHAKRIKDPLAAKIITWLTLAKSDTRASFEDISHFIGQNPGWPNIDRLLGRAEEKMPPALPPAEVLVWFDRHPPVSIDGRMRLGAALIAKDRKKEGREIIRKAWIEGNFGKRRQKDFYRLYRKHLTAADHIKRLDSLIWAGRYWQARRMLWKVDAKYRALAEARLMLMRMKGNVDAAIRLVPAELKDDPGLVYERLRWRRRKGRDLSAGELLNPPPDTLVVMSQDVVHSIQL